MSEETAELVAGAHTAFADAVHALVGLRPDTIERDDYTCETVVLDSLYAELLEAKYGEKQDQGSVRRAVHGSNAPGNTDIISLLDRIDRRVHLWWPSSPFEPAEQPITVRRLYALVDYQWRPQDVAELRSMTREVQAWADRAEALLTGGRTWELRAPCPSCGETVVNDTDSSGETVRRYVLQANLSSAACLACGTTWAPEHYKVLAGMIGTLPAGVLE